MSEKDRKLSDLTEEEYRETLLEISEHLGIKRSLRIAQRISR